MTSCKKVKELDRHATSGLYWIDPDNGSHTNAFQAFCDMETDGGGWTLVYSYTFTKYDAFTNSGNALTPRPNWQASRTNVRVSTTSPKKETDLNAMDFKLWRQIGNEVLIKSNINHWVSCSPGTGSLVLMKAGSFSCKVVKQIAFKCPKTAPNKVSIHSQGPSLEYNSHYYLFESDRTSSWPTHDPCGNNGANQVKDVYSLQSSWKHLHSLNSKKFRYYVTKDLYLLLLNTC